MGKYIVLSDLHLGQNGADREGQYSLLSQIADSLPAEKKRADATMARLETKVRAFAKGRPVTLIAVGDVLDLSLASFADALADLGALLRKLTPVRHMVWIVGNHDHHIWSMHCEETRCFSRLRQSKAPLDGGVYRPTAAEGERLSFLEKRLATVSGKSDLKMTIAYPSFRMRLRDNRKELSDSRREVLFYFTHGHLFGGLYTTVSKILQDRLPGSAPEATLATVNLSLIEFIYWLLGETGEGFGADGLIETVYTDLQKGDSGLAAELINDAIDRLLAKGIVTGIPDSWGEPR